MGRIWRPQAGSPHLCRDCHCHACRTCASMTPSRAWAGLSSPRAVGSPGRGELSAVFQVTPQDSSKLAGPTEGVGLLCSPAGQGGGCALASSGTAWAPHLPPPCQFLLQGPTWRTCTGWGRSLSNGAALDARGLGRARRQAGRPLSSPAGTHTSGPSADGWPQKRLASCGTSAPAALCTARSPS